MSYIDLEYRENTVHCEVHLNSLNILSNDQLPLFFQVLSLNNTVIESFQIEPGTWRRYVKSFRDKKFRVVTKRNIVLRELEYDYKKDFFDGESLDLYEFWDYFTKMNSKTVGLILGAGDGLWGEWVDGVLKNKVSCFLVEGSNQTAKNLFFNYGHLSHLKIINEIVSLSGETMQFYDSLGGYNSVNEDYLKLLNIDLSNAKVSHVKTKSLNDLLEEIGQVNWIRFDIEGIDLELVLSIDFTKFSNLMMVQYEHLGLSNEQRDKVKQKFISENYDVIEYRIDTIFLKK